MPDKTQNPQPLRFGTLPDHVIHHFRLLHLELNRMHARIFEGTLMERGVGKLTALAMISFNEGINQTMISRAIRREKAAVARILHELEADGLIVRQANPSSRRANTLTITAKGRQSLAEYQELSRQCEAAFTEALSAEERTQLLALLRKMRRHHSPDDPGVQEADEPS